MRGTQEPTYPTHAYEAKVARTFLSALGISTLPACYTGNRRVKRCMEDKLAAGVGELVLA